MICLSMISATFWKRIVLIIKPDPEGLHLLLTETKYAWIWKIFNWIPALSNAVMKRIYLSKYSRSFLIHVNI